MAEFTDPWLPSPDESGRVSPVRRPVRTEVYRVNGTSGNGQTDPADVSPVYLPSVACVSVEEREGPYPPSATFRYKFDGRDPSSPRRVEQALSTTVTASTLPHLVEVGDRLAVLAYFPDGGTDWVFDGFPLAWSFSLSGGVESVVMEAVSVAKRQWDTPIGGAVVRDSDEPEAVNDFETDQVAQLNPRGEPNASPSTADSGGGSQKYPVLMDPSLRGTDTDGVDYPRPWDLAMAAAYLIFTNTDGAWVKVPTRAQLDALLVARDPIDGTPFDPTDSSTYTAKPIQCPDTPLTGRAWPAVLAEMIGPAGFGMRYTVGTGSDGNPETRMELFLRQGQASKPLLLQEEGSTFDAAQSNVAAADLARDLSGVVNRYEVVGHALQYEASFVLAPGFPSAQADSASSAALAAFNSTDSSFHSNANEDKYRLWVLDEDGSGHYPNNPTSTAGPTTEVTGTATSLDDVLGPPDADGNPLYGPRRRPPAGELFSAADGSKQRLRYSLSASTDYAGSYPAVWDGTGTWKPVKGGFSLLKDRVGFRLTDPDPNGWNTGQHPAKVFKLVQSIGNPDTTNPAVFFRLTCAIEGDAALKGVAERQSSSPLVPAITRQVDARDRLFKRTIAKHSEYNNTASAVTARDDSDLAKAEADSYRTAAEAGVMGGTALVRRFTRAYRVGDRISEIRGRGLGLRTDTGGSGFAPVLPVVVSVRHELEGRQATTLTLSDAGLDRRRYGLKFSGRPKGIYSKAEVPESERDGTGYVRS